MSSTSDSYYYYDDYYYYGNYTYEYPNTSTIQKLPDHVYPVAIVYGLIGLTGLIGNLLVIFAIVRTKRMKTITNRFLLSLALADLLLVLICVPVKGVAFFSYTWTLGEFLCRSVNYVQNVSMICSVLTLTVMSLERFVAIQYPLKARSICTARHAWVVIASVWAFSFVAAVPIIFVIDYQEVGRAPNIGYWCHKRWVHQPMVGIGYELAMFALMFCIPVGVMLVTYICIAQTLWTVASRRADMRSGSCISNDIPSERPSICTDGSLRIPRVPGTAIPLTVMVSNGTAPQKKTYVDDDKTRRQVVLMLMVVVLLFAICWAPILVNNVLVAFEVLDHLHTGYLRPMRIAFHIMSYANSCVNPFVYAFLSKNFRDGFKQAVIICVKGKKFIRQQLSARSRTPSTRVSTSNSSSAMATYMRENISDSIAARRPSDMVDDNDVRRL